MKYTRHIKRGLALFISVLLAMPTFAYAGDPADESVWIEDAFPGENAVLEGEAPEEADWIEEPVSEETDWIEEPVSEETDWIEETASEETAWVEEAIPDETAWDEDTSPAETAWDEEAFSEVTGGIPGDYGVFMEEPSETDAIDAVWDDSFVDSGNAGDGDFTDDVAVEAGIEEGVEEASSSEYLIEADPDEIDPADFTEEPEEEPVEESGEEPAEEPAEESEEEPEEEPEEDAVEEPEAEGPEGEAKEEPADKEARQEAFDQSKTVNGVIVTVRAEPGVFPEGAELSVKKVPLSQQRQADAAVEEVRSDDRNVAASYTFDIKVIHPATKEEYEPSEGQTVEVSFGLPEVADENLTTSVYHITEEESGGGLAAEALDVMTEVTPKTGEETTAVVETDGFSLYTVEFTYGELQYVLQGGKSVPLADILEAVGLTGETQSVTVSDETLFDAYPEDGMWMVAARRAFLTTEWMKVTINGLDYEIIVTDDPDGAVKVAGVPLVSLPARVTGENGGYAELSMIWGGLQLELNNFVWTSDDVPVIANTENIGLVILLNGSNDLTSNNSEGIYSNGHLTITGEGSLSVKGTSGIICDEAIYIDNGVKMTAVSTGSSPFQWAIQTDTVDNQAAGTGWPDKDGRSDGEVIPVVPGAQELRYKKVQFPISFAGLQILIDKTISGSLQISNYADKNNCITALPTEEGLTIAGGRTITIDLGNCTIDGRNLANNANCLTVSGDLTLTDSSKGGTVIGSGSGVAVAGNGEFTLNGGTVTGSGSGVTVNEGSTFTLDGGTITGSGSGVAVNNGIFTMESGTITRNTAADGAGVLMSGGRFDMNGGEISNNIAASCGGGVYIERGSFTMSGGKIVNNNAVSDGGGIFVGPGADAFRVKSNNGIKILGNVAGGTITDGTFSGGTAGNVYLSAGKTITISGEMKENDEIHVTTETAPAMDTPVVITRWFNRNGGRLDSIFSDHSDYSLFLTDKTDSGEAVLAVPVTVSVSAAGLEGIDGTVGFEFTPENGDAVKRWFRDGDDPVSFDGLYGRKVILTAGNLDGCSFINWTENGTKVGTEPEIEWTLDGNRALVANYLQNQIIVEADLQGREWQDDDSFTFTLTPVGDAPHPIPDSVTVTKTSVGHAEAFGRIQFTGSDAGKSYTYKISQTKGSIPDITYDTGEKTVTYTVEQNGSTIKLTPSPVQTVTFENVYEPDATAPHITKEPDSLSLTYGYTGNNVLSVEVENLPDHTYSYQWYSGSESGGSFTEIDGATDASYTVPTGRTAGTEEYYYCEVTAARGRKTAKKASKTVSVTVGKKTVGLEWSNTSFTYDGKEHVPTAEATGLIGGDACKVTVEGGQTNAGTAAYTARATQLSNSNYSLPDQSEQSFTIGKRTITITAKAQSVELNGIPADGTNMVEVTGGTLADGHKLSSVALSGSTAVVTTTGTIKPGNAVIMSGGEDVTANYEITYKEGVLTVTKGIPVVAAEPGARAVTYGQKLSLSAIKGRMKDAYNDAAVDGTFAWDVPEVMPSVSDSKSTGYPWTFTPEDSKNYASVKGTLTVTVNPAGVKLTANSRNTDTYDGTEKTVTGFTCSVTGLTFASTVKASGSGTNAGTYDVTFSGVQKGRTKDSTGNYVVKETVNGKLTIMKGTPAVSASGYSGVYDGKPHGITVKTDKKNVKVYFSTKPLTSRNYLQAGNQSPVRTDAGKTTVYYCVTGSDYKTVTGSKVIVIRPKPITVIADAEAKTAGDQDPKLTFKVKGLIGRDKLTGSLTRDKGEAAGSYNIRLGTLTAGGNYTISFTGAKLTIKKKAEPVVKPGGKVIAKMVSAGRTSLKLTWTKATGVDGYDVFFKICDGKQNFPLIASVDSAKNKCTIKGLKKGKSYKAFVRPWIMKDGDKTYVLRKSPNVHCFTNGGNKNKTNPASLKVKNASVTLKKGESASIKATVKGLQANKKILRHYDLLRYYSGNRSVATVNSEGKITAKGEGSCVIYVLTSNGICKKVKVTVGAAVK